MARGSSAKVIIAVSGSFARIACSCVAAGSPRSPKRGLAVMEKPSFFIVSSTRRFFFPSLFCEMYLLVFRPLTVVLPSALRFMS